MSVPAVPRDLDGAVVATIINNACSGTHVVRIGDPATLRIRLANRTNTPMVLGDGSAGASPTRIELTFRSADAGLQVDPAKVSCPWFHVTAANATTIVLTSTVPAYQWLVGDMINIWLEDVTFAGRAGLHMVDAVLTGFLPKAEWRNAIAYFALGTAMEDGAARAKVRVSRRSPLVRSPRIGRPIPNDLNFAIDMPPETRTQPPVRTTDASQVFISLIVESAKDLMALSSVDLAAKAEAKTRRWALDTVQTAAAPIWRLRPADPGHGWSGQQRLTSIQIGLSQLATRQSGPTGHMLVCMTGFEGIPDSYEVVSMDISDSVPVISSLTATPASFTNITQPQTVTLSWSTTGASFVTLSGYGSVPSSIQSFAAVVEATTVFTLTAYNANLNQIASQSVTVTVDPSIADRLVPVGAIVPWSGSVAQVPPGWLLCGGGTQLISAYGTLAALLGTTYGGDGVATFGIPDLRDRFVVGAGTGSTAPAQQSGAADTHTHNYNQLSNSFTTDFQGDHTHGMPSNWYARNLSSGGHTGIDTNGDFSTNTQTQNAGGHTHTVSVTFPAGTSDANSGDVRPPWFALCYLVKA